MSVEELPSLGDVIAGRYRLIAPIGEGGMGAVYRAEQLGLGREVAVKVILPQRAGSERARRRFIREAKLTAAVKHAGVVQIYDYGDAEGVLYIAMEILSGPALRDLIDYDLPPLPQRRAIEIAIRIAEVLDATSSVPLVHRDLKPENILFDTDVQGTVRLVLVDFGLAFATEADDDTGRMTKEGVLSGTPDYMSPEQCRGEGVGPKCDVYALGCILHEMLTASPPFRGEPAVQLSRHLFVPPKSIRVAYPDIVVHGSLDDLVLDMLTKDPADRPDAASVVARLRRIDASAPERMSARSTDEERTGRAARMISAGSVRPPPPRSPVAGAQALGSLWWRGAADGHAVEALIVGGVHVTAGDERPAEFDAVFAPRATTQEVADLAATHAVITTAPKEIEQMSAMLKAGAAEALPIDYDVSDLVRRVQRVLRRNRRGRRR